MEPLLDVVERRATPRYRAKEGVFAVLPLGFKLGQIEDIGTGGLSFCYVPLDEPNVESDELEIYFVYDGFNLNGIPYETVSDYSLNEDLPFNYVERRRYSLKFGTMTSFQQMQLNNFIENYTEFP